LRFTAYERRSSDGRRCSAAASTTPPSMRRRCTAALARASGRHPVAKTDPPLISDRHARGRAHRRAPRQLAAGSLSGDRRRLGVPLLKGPTELPVVAARPLAEKRRRSMSPMGEAMARQVCSAARAGGVASSPLGRRPSDFTRPSRRHPLRREWVSRTNSCSGIRQPGRPTNSIPSSAAASACRAMLASVFCLSRGHRLVELAGRVKALASSRCFGSFPIRPRRSEIFARASPTYTGSSLRPDLEGLVVPSKFYGIAAAGRPIIAVAATDGEIAQLIARYHCGFPIAPATPTNSPPRSRRCPEITTPRRHGDARTGHAGRSFHRRQALERWRHVLAPRRGPNWTPRRPA